MNDVDLWRSFRNGDDHAFSMLYQTYIEVLYKYGHKLTIDSELVEDAIQDMFIELWNSRQRLSDTDSVKFYLFRVLRRKITQNPLMRKTTDCGIESMEQKFFSGSAESQLIDTESEGTRKKMLGRALLKLPPRQQEVVNLRFFNEFNHQQIAEIMNISIQSVHNTLQKSMKGLREILSDYSEIILSAVIMLCFGN
ncbi:RNA polymerase sigma factor [Dyadobacter subterraneus]|uniref:Sigma-70 family RNA polymerase sigma factor n=1 Tax=Dyadobacter subterraneus TaxID=2773304 RepID=A0ABR9WGV8_9BACT|nr:sigma-70 family RNA polymerase sigma factor [Dyadobacter subterraneus]MBE9464742.1 sigma-70 family RNA polymerase sigma factor [Dyadobacter subterraneus]